VGTHLCNAINIVKQTESELSRVQDEVANKVNTKLQTVLERNPGYLTLCKDSDILCGNEAELCGNEEELSAKDLTLFMYSPVTSYDVERSFSRYKVLLSDNRRSFQFDNFKRLHSSHVPNHTSIFIYNVMMIMMMMMMIIIIIIIIIIIFRF
jgi:hypothetical protein